MSNQSSVQSEGVTSDTKIRDVLRRQIQRAYDKRLFTRAQLEAESGVNVHTIDTIVSRDPAKHRRIAAEDALNLAYTLGEDAVTAVVGTIFFTARRANASGIEVSQIVAQILPHVSTIAKAASDGRIDHLEQPDCTNAADQIIATMIPLSSSAGGTK